MNEYVALVE